MATSKGNKDIIGIWSQIHFAETTDDNSLWLQHREKTRPNRAPRQRKKKILYLRVSHCFRRSAYIHSENKDLPYPAKSFFLFYDQG